MTLQYVISREDAAINRPKPDRIKFMSIALVKQIGFSRTASVKSFFSNQRTAWSRVSSNRDKSRNKAASFGASLWRCSQRFRGMAVSFGAPDGALSFFGIFCP